MELYNTALNAAIQNAIDNGLGNKVKNIAKAVFIAKNVSTFDDTASNLAKTGVFRDGYSIGRNEKNNNVTVYVFDSDAETVANTINQFKFDRKISDKEAVKRTAKYIQSCINRTIWRATKTDPNGSWIPELPPDCEIRTIEELDKHLTIAENRRAQKSLYKYITDEHVEKAWNLIQMKKVLEK